MKIKFLLKIKNHSKPQHNKKYYKEHPMYYDTKKALVDSYDELVKEIHELEGSRIKQLQPIIELKEFYENKLDKLQRNARIMLIDFYEDVIENLDHIISSLQG